MSSTSSPAKAGSSCRCAKGRQQPAEIPLREGYLPLGLARQVKLRSDVAEGACVTWADLDIDASDPVVRVRREMGAAFAPEAAHAA